MNGWSRGPRCGLGLAAFLLAVVSSSGAQGAPQAYRLIFTDDAACGVPGDFQARMVQKLGQDPFFFSAPDALDVRIEREGGLSRAASAVGGKVWARYTFLDAANQKTGEHEPFSAETCDELLETLFYSLIPALQQRLAEPVPPPQEAPPPAEPPAAAAVETQPRAAAKVPGPLLAVPVEKLKLQLRFGVDVGALFAFAPEALPGASVSLGVRIGLSPPSALSFSIEGRTAYPMRQFAEKIGTDLEMWPFIGVLASCYHESIVSICAPIGGGGFRVTTYDRGGESPLKEPFLLGVVIAGARIGLEVPVSASFRARAFVEALVPLLRPAVCQGCKNEGIQKLGSPSEDKQWEMPEMAGTMYVGAVADFL